MAHQNQADLEWLAFQYVSEELSAEDVALFEERLAVDQTAREAVAEAMLLLQAVSAGARIASPVQARRSWTQHAAWAAIGAAACLAVVFVLRSLPKQSPLAQRPQASDLSSAELALVWAQSDPYGEPEAADPTAEEENGLAAEIDRELVVPVWMLEAVSGAAEVKPVIKESQES